MLGFYVLALGIAGALLWAVYAQVVYLERVNLQLLIFCVVAAGLILWSVIPRVDRFEPPGPRLLAGEHPRLFRELEAVAGAVGQAMPREVYLVPNVNAFVTSRGGVMGFGSRRVMGLGLCLMRILSVRELRAVLAHEFGHYHGGDTALGPWIHKTRSAISRTLQALSQHRHVLLHVFAWYGHMFMKITHAISRQQEFAADALAARVVGPVPLADGLRMVARGALAEQPYWRFEVAPILRAGFQPAIADGFAAYLEAPSVRGRIDEAVAIELAEGTADPFDTHPPLRERIAALGADRASMPAADDDAPAITLLSEAAALERKLVAAVGGTSGLPAIAWSEVAATVYVGRWKAQVAEAAALLTGVTPEAFPELARRARRAVSTDADGAEAQLAAGAASADAADDRPIQLRLTDAADVARAVDHLRAATVAPAALSLLLLADGWTPRSAPGDHVFERSGERIDPVAALNDLASERLAPADWLALCERTGIAAWDLHRAVELSNRPPA
jgi:Zn-dependent protease with chaperone function